LRLESGDINPKNRHINGDLRRRRKWYLLCQAYRQSSSIRE
jgi:hypothetical protein